MQAGDALVVMRTLAAIADALAAFAGPRAGTSGPLANSTIHKKLLSLIGHPDGNERLMHRTALGASA
jgi:hypothetical protein